MKRTDEKRVSDETCGGCLDALGYRFSCFCFPGFELWNLAWVADRWLAGGDPFPDCRSQWEFSAGAGYIGVGVPGRRVHYWRGHLDRSSESSISLNRWEKCVAGQFK